MKKVSHNRKVASVMGFFAVLGAVLGITLSGGHGGHAPIGIGRPSTTHLIRAGLYTPHVGTQMHASNGIWVNTVTTFDYQWQDCNSSGASCVPVGSDSALYTPTSSDLGKFMDVVVTATNSFGNATQTSLLTAAVQPAVVTVSIGTGPDKAGGCTSSNCSTISAPSPLGSTGTGAWSYNGANATVSSCATYSYSGAYVLNGPTVSGSAERCSINSVMSTDGVVSQTHFFFVQQPTGMNVHDNANPVPVVFVWPDSCVPDPNTPGCFVIQNSTDNGDPSWESWDTNAANPDKYMIVTIYADYLSPTGGGAYANGLLGGNGAGATNACGSSVCDQTYQAYAVLQWLESRFSINTNQVWNSGGSKGGTMADSIICNPVTQAVFTGTAIGSHLNRSAQLASIKAYPPISAMLPPNQGGGVESIPGNCSGLVKDTSHNLPNPVTTARSAMVGIWFGIEDSGVQAYGAQGTPPIGFPSANFSENQAAGSLTTATGQPLNISYNGGAVNGCTFNPATSPPPTGVITGNCQIVYGPDEEATGYIGPAFGCSPTPTKGPAGAAGSVAIGGGKVFTRTYYGCNSNGSFIGAVQVVDFYGSTPPTRGTDSCHAFSCSSTGGSTEGVQIAQQQEDFFLTGAAS